MAVLGLLCALAQQSEAGYKFVTISHSSFPHSTRKFGVPAINNEGTVAFRFYDTTNRNMPDDRIYTSSDGFLTQIAKAAGALKEFSDYVSINNAGTVAFRAKLDAGTGQTWYDIYTGNGGPLTSVAVSASTDLRFLSDPDINDAGTVAFRAEKWGGVTGIYTINGKTFTTVADSTGGLFTSLGPALDFAAPAINNAEQVAFWGAQPPPSLPLTQGIFTSTGPGTFPTVIMDSSSAPGSLFDRRPALNNSGTVVFVRTHPSFSLEAPKTMYTGSGGPPVAIAASDPDWGPFVDFGSVSINDSGTVAFWGVVGGDEPAALKGQGIFAGASMTNIFGQPVTSHIKDKVIRRGDWLDGAQVVALRFSRDGFNNKGQVAFYAELSDGRRGIYRADPNPVYLNHLVVVTIIPGFIYNGRTGRYEQEVTLTNVDSEPIPGPLWLVLEDLSPSVRLSNATSLLPPRDPYVEVPERGLAPGASVSMLLEFFNPSGRPIIYTPTVQASPNRR